MTLEKRIWELIAIGASVGANCRSCLRFHAREALESGASAEEVAEAIAVGRDVRRGAAANVDACAAQLRGDAGNAPVATCACGGEPECRPGEPSGRTAAAGRG